MGCPHVVEVSDNLVFSICTHDPDTGVLTDADGAPSYRIYEDETAAAILTGSMAKLDDGNTTGFYSELIACTVANGFEEGKTYTIYIEATVDSDTGGISFGFRVTNKIAGVAMTEAMRRVSAVVGGKISGAGTGTETFVDWETSLNTIVVTVDASGNRHAVTFN